MSGQRSTPVATSATIAAIAPSDTVPEAAKGMRNLSQGTVLKLASPCVIWVYYNGRWYQIPC